MKLRRRRSVAENAVAMLPKMAQKYFEAGREALHRKTPPEDLHRFRIATKQFRYTLELFQPVYGTSLNRYIEALRVLQGTLGDVSDYQTIGVLLSGDKALETKLQRALKHKLKELRQQWRAFDGDGELERWKTYLASGSRRKPVRRADAKMK